MACAHHLLVLRLGERRHRLGQRDEELVQDAQLLLVLHLHQRAGHHPDPVLGGEIVEVHVEGAIIVQGLRGSPALSSSTRASAVGVTFLTAFSSWKYIVKAYEQ